MSRALVVTGITVAALAVLARWRAGQAGQAAPAVADVQAAPAKPRRSWTTPATGARYAELFERVNRAYGFPAGLVSRLAWQESRYNPRATSPKGALGMFQFMPRTAAELGVDPLDPEAAAWAAGRYLAQLFNRFGDWVSALAAYNWGQGNVSRGLAGAPAETRSYVVNILTDIGLIDP